jgi:hypothetical protein
VIERKKRKKKKIKEIIRNGKTKKEAKKITDDRFCRFEILSFFWQAEALRL